MSISGHDENFGKIMMKLLGLPKNTRGFDLHCHVNEIVVVDCTYYIDKPETTEIITERFRLERIEEEEDDGDNTGLHNIGHERPDIES